MIFSGINFPKLSDLESVALLPTCVSESFYIQAVKYRKFSQKKKIVTKL
jgi:hypothetical protein